MISGHRSPFPNVIAAGRRFRMGHRSSFPNVWFTGRPFQMYGLLVVLFKCIMGHRSAFQNVWVAGQLCACM